MIYVHPGETSLPQHQDSAGTVPSGTPPPSPPQTRAGTQSHSATNNPTQATYAHPQRGDALRPVHFSRVKRLTGHTHYTHTKAEQTTHTKVVGRWWCCSCRVFVCVTCFSSYRRCCVAREFRHDGVDHQSINQRSSQANTGKEKPHPGFPA